MANADRHVKIATRTAGSVMEANRRERAHALGLAVLQAPAGEETGRAIRTFLAFLEPSLRLAASTAPDPVPTDEGRRP